METNEFKFNVDDKVICTKLGNATEGDEYAIEDQLEVGSIYTVSNVGDNGLRDQYGSWIELKETPHKYWHHVGSFKPYNPCTALTSPMGIIVLLRRPRDRGAIERHLEDAGYLWDCSYSSRIRSRIIAVHINGKYKGELTFNDRVGFDVGTKEAIKVHSEFSKEFFGYDNHIVIKTKPSVSKAIVELEKFI